MLGGLPLMVQVVVFDGEFLDLFSAFYNGRGATEVNVGERNLADAFVVALVVVVLDEGSNLVFEVTG
jgi:hypothetical protein